MTMTNYTEDLVLDWLLTANAATRPTAWWVGLYTAAPSDTGGGTEVSTGSYARQSSTFTVSGTSPTLATNSAQIDFPTATGSWGTITHMGIFDAVSAGNLLWWGALTASKTIAIDDVFRFIAGAIDLTLD
jgi:hypothetical protein